MPAPPHNPELDPAGFAQIDAALQTALAILTDPVAPARGALPHLVEARDGLVDLAGRDDAVCARLEALELTGAPDDALYDVAANLSDETRALKQRLLPAAAARATLYRRMRRGAVGLALLIVAAIVAVIWIRDRTPGPWHGKYFQNMEFKAPLRVRRDKNINFNWGSGIPHRALPTDRFSIRWDTCLDVSREISPTFQLTADDGARLFVDGQRIIDIWNAPRGDTQSGRAVLAPGSHHLRVEYYDNKGRARVALRISIDGEKPRSIPRAMLRYPGNTFGRTNPCQAGVPEEPVEEPAEQEHQAPTADEAAAPPSEDEPPAVEDN